MPDGRHVGEGRIGFHANISVVVIARNGSREYAHDDSLGDDAIQTAFAEKISGLLRYRSQRRDRKSRVGLLRLPTCEALA
jgi:hypothetical protein